MKNFVFLSPNFPEDYWQFCMELRNNGLRVLGIGDCPYDHLTPQLKNALHEYYKVSSLENYDEVYRAMGYFIHKYGRIDWLESNNEYWLMRDAHLRTDFHITSGFQAAEMAPMKYKSAMKAFYAKAGVPTAQYCLPKSYEEALDFIKKVGYPLVAKPDNGVGANDTYLLYAQTDLDRLFAEQDITQYIMEPFVKGFVQTYDAIINAEGEILFDSSLVTPVSCMETVNDHTESLLYATKDIDPKIVDAGQRVIRAYGIRSRFIHLEFFVLTEDQPILGRTGDVVGLEVNMRPAGDVSPHLYNFACETNVFKIYADMIAFDRNTLGNTAPKHFAASIGRRDNKRYKMNHDDIMTQYGHCMKSYGVSPEALAPLMGDRFYIAIFDSEEELQRFYWLLRETVD